MPPRQLLHPRYWLLWLALALAWLLARLPLSTLWWLGQRLGWLLQRLAHRRRDIARRNLALAFPQRTPSDRQRLLDEHFAQLGTGLMESLLVWFGNAHQLTRRLSVTGLTHLHAAQQPGKGVILCVFHTVHMEAMGLLAGSLFPVHPVYRPQDNPLLEWVTARHRSRHTAGAIPNREVRRMLTTLRQGGILWLSPDQRHRAGGLPVPFFGHDALTHPSIARMARSSGAAVVPLFCHLDAQGRFQLRLLPALQDFPGSDDRQALTRLMQLLETDIALAPEQYLWVHNRFNLPHQRTTSAKDQSMPSSGGRSG